ncbi:MULTISPECIES: hypothetical protein [unclassified Streptococcus]|uniref:hypothetical protein n=1 Tax=unclassified Streptococcus TaxID=2608887 RepID=UPI00107292C3|nr:MULTISPECIES: hypothetical protein [unclassified Streptococcus]MBF0786849.1 hypothetical protein [Streptococcus sp. 19428wC2_LYSM12]MCQ9212741.1 hypothetical protein [Streptococcus sp. B01]MCQ9214082.1 hypothetical protein [Streptococcus sp. O1]TFV06219.1 hypothetical protein E4T79_02825 [Streptococcus sp. LYSM12]
MDKIIASILKSLKEQREETELLIIQVSRKEGEKRINSIEWENFCLDLRNDMLFQFKLSYSPESAKGWNQFARHYREEFSSSIKDFLRTQFFSEETVISIGFDMGNVIIYKSIQQEYGFSFQFYEEMYNIYKSGYIPVGYEGAYPNGKMVVMKL